VLQSVDEQALALMVGRKTVAELLAEGAPSARGMLVREVPPMVDACKWSPGLPRLMHSLLSQEIFRHPRGFDWLVSELVTLRSIDLAAFLLYLCPRVVPLEAPGELLPPSAASLAAGTWRVVHTANRVFVWGAADAAGDGEEEAVKEVVKSCWEVSGRYLPVEVVRQGDEREQAVRARLLDDSVECGSNLEQWVTQIKGGRAAPSQRWIGGPS
jgi:hypothetical protein